jgi:hypothetical protein
MIFLGFGKYARADRIYALDPLLGDERGGGRRTRVWVEGIADPIIASRTERTILHDMGQDAASASASPRPPRKAASTSATWAGARGASSRPRRTRRSPRSSSRSVGRQSRRR